MSYHWQKNTEAITRAPLVYFRYRGLKFPNWDGLLTREEARSGSQYFAFFGGKKLTDKAIQYHVDKMIEQGIYRDKAA